MIYTYNIKTYTFQSAHGTMFKLFSFSFVNLSDWILFCVVFFIHFELDAWRKRKNKNKIVWNCFDLPCGWCSFKPLCHHCIMSNLNTQFKKFFQILWSVVVAFLFFVCFVCYFSFKYVIHMLHYILNAIK